MPIEVFVADEQSDHPVDAPRWDKLARDVLKAQKVKGDAELSVLFVDEQTIAALNEKFLGKQGPTDVLAFPMDELRPPPPGSGRGDQGAAGDATSPPGLLGDVVLCPEVAAEQAAQAHHPLRDELELLCTHGILHLLGYDHAEPEERTAMFGLQDELLATWRPARDQPSDLGRDPEGQEGTG